MTLDAFRQTNKPIRVIHVRLRIERFSDKPGDAQSWKLCCSKWERWFPGRFRRKWWSFSSWARTPAAGRSPARCGWQSDKCSQEEPSQLRPERSGNRLYHPAQPTPLEQSPFFLFLISLSSDENLVMVSYKSSNCVELRQNLGGFCSIGEKGRCFNSAYRCRIVRSPSVSCFFFSSSSFRLLFPLVMRLIIFYC